MNAQTVASSLPAAAFLVPLGAGVLVFAARGLSRRLWQVLTLAGAAATLLIGVEMLREVLAGAVLVTWRNELRVDGLGALMVLVISGIAFLAAIYSVPYQRRPQAAGRNGEDHGERRLCTFYGLLLWFLGTMVWGCVTNNVVMLYVAVEATTLASGLLVAHYWDRAALEAGYKYFMLLTIGLTFALFGCVLIYAGAASTGALSGIDALLMSEVRTVVHAIPAGTAAFTVAFLVVGFGTKAGLAPFHPWLPDAHAEAPIPVSVLLSGVMIKMAAYALARTTSMFFPAWSTLTLFLVALGVLSMLLGILLAMTQDDLKRMLAYSSVSQIGYVVAGIGLGTYLGCYGGLYHLVNHAVGKSLLFLCVGAVIYATGLRRISELGGLKAKMPFTSACFIVGALMISGLPPLGGFMSKLTVFLALARSGLWWAAVIAVVTGILTMVVLVRPAIALFWGSPPGLSNPAPHGSAVVAETTPQIREVPRAMLVPMVILAALCVLLGTAPQLPFPLLDNAATALATLGR